MLQNIDVEPLIDLDGACRILNLSKSCIYKKTSARILPFYRLGGRIFFLASELQAFIQDHRVEPLRNRD